MDLSALHIAVIGAGIGGLAVARACALRGARVTVHEQAVLLGWKLPLMLSCPMHGCWAESVAPV